MRPWSRRRLTLREPSPSRGWAVIWMLCFAMGVLRLSRTAVIQTAAERSFLLFAQCPSPRRAFLFEQGADRLVVVDPVDRLGEQGGDAQHDQAVLDRIAAGANGDRVGHGNFR